MSRLFRLKQGKGYNKWVEAVWWHYDEKEDFQDNADDAKKLKCKDNVWYMYLIGMTAKQAGKSIRFFESHPVHKEARNV